jgi:hypothetical protein
MANQLKGEGTKSNLHEWSEYARRNSYDQSESKAQSRKDWGRIESFHAEEVDYPEDARTVPEKATFEGKGWKHWSDVSKTNSYTGKGGSRRD